MATESRILRDGLIVGIIGYSSVAALYAAFDIVAARGILYTVDLLGKSVFRGARDTGVLGVPIQLDVTTIFWYNALHLLVSLAIGLIVIGLVEQAERRPSQAPIITFTIVAGFIVTIIAVGWLSTPIRPLLPWWSIVVSNALASLLAGMYLLRQHPGVLRRLTFFAG